MAKLPSAAARGYDARHRRERTRWERIIKAQGVVPCHRQGPNCVGPIRDGDKWDLGHTDDRTAWTGPECIPCNRGAGGRNGAKVTNAKRQMIVRDW